MLGLVCVDQELLSMERNPKWKTHENAKSHVVSALAIELPYII